MSTTSPASHLVSRCARLVIAFGLGFGLLAPAQAQQPSLQAPLACFTEQTPLDPLGFNIHRQRHVHALVVLVRFYDDTVPSDTGWPIEPQPGYSGYDRLPDWARSVVEPDSSRINASSLSLASASLSAFSFYQSRLAVGGPHILSGEVWPRVASGEPVVYRPQHRNSFYTDSLTQINDTTFVNSNSGDGYGVLVQEILNHLVADPRFDISRFDADHDGILDQIFLVVRSDIRYQSVGGVASLRGNIETGTLGGPNTLSYPSSSSPSGSVVVNLNGFGSGNTSWVGRGTGERIMAHEYMHNYLNQVHTYMIEPPNNDVPYNIIARGADQIGRWACAYNLMCGGESSNYDLLAPTLSGHVVRQAGWATRTLIRPSDGNRQDVVVRPLYGDGHVVLIPLNKGGRLGSPDTLSLETRHRVDGFNNLPAVPSSLPDYVRVYQHLAASGMLITLGRGQSAGGSAQYDYAPPDNQYDVRANSSRCASLINPECYRDDAFVGDMYRPGVATQMSPWTRPNVSGFTYYPNATAHNWFAVDGIRYIGLPDSSMAFDLVADVRNEPVFTVRKDSWWGPETSGQTLREIHVGPGATLTVESGVTVTLTGDLVVDLNARLNLNGATLRFAPGKRLRVYGRLDATEATLTATNPAQGWGGVVISPPPGAGKLLAPQPQSDLRGVTVSHVQHVPEPGVRYLYSPFAAVEVRDRTVRIGSYTDPVTQAETRSEFSDAVFANGLRATGSSARVTINGASALDGNEGHGIVASAGAHVTFTDRSTANGNLGGGIRADGYGSRVTMDGFATADDNEGVGVLSDRQAHVSVRTPTTTTPFRTSVSRNDGGPTTFAGASFDGSQCRPDGSTGRPNLFINNHQGFYDARAEGGSTVSAPYAYWGPNRTSLLLMVDKSSTINVFPLATTEDTPQPNCLATERTAAPAGLARRGDASALRGTPSDEVLTLTAEARAAGWRGDFTVAYALLDQALAAVTSDDDREAVFEATAALVADDRPASVLVSLRARAAGGGADQPWARRALAIAEASDGNAPLADALAAALTTEYTGSPHAVFGHALRVRLAVEADSAALALARLEDFEAIAMLPDTAAVESYGAALALVAAVFPESSLPGASARAAGADASMAASTTLEDGAVDGVSVWPNPSSGRVNVHLSLRTSATTVRASVHDVLGRRVVVLHEGPLGGGAHALGFDAATLAPGVYVVRVLVTPAVGEAWSETHRVTVAR